MHIQTPAPPGTPSRMFTLPAPLSCSGFELVSRILDHPEGGVEALIELAGGGETDWLEFKAAMVGRPEDRKNPRENDADGYWNVAEAVLAMANSRGGVVLLGVDDNANAVGLAAGDPRRVLETRGMDAFLRMEVLERIHPSNSGCRWNTGLKGIWELEHPWPPDQFVIRTLQFQGQSIAALLVKPVPVGSGCLIATQNGEERLLKRVEGNLGRVECLRGRVAIPEYERTRGPLGEDLGSLLARFFKRVEKGGTEEDDLEAALEAWHRKFQKQSTDLNMFTPLDAEERLNVEDCFESLLPAAAFEPEAEEILPDYIREDWLEYDSDDEREDEAPEETEGIESAWDFGATSDQPEPQRVPASPRVARRGGLFELLSEEPRTVLIGEPGGGKTTCLRRLTLESALQYQPGQTVTLFLPLAKWAASGGLSTLIRRTTGLSMGQLERLILSDRCRLLFDGLNECPDSLRAAAINELTALLENYPKLQLVISTRAAESVAHLRLPTFSVQPLSDSQQIKFLKAYLPDPERASKLFEQIQFQPGAETFASNPLLLRMIVEVAGKDGELPKGRALLYRRWIHDWYRREKEKGDRAKDPLPWNEQETFEGLSAIALAARLRGSRIATEEEALNTLGGLVKNRGDFLRRMTQTPLLRREDGHFQFRHETFQEYLCAEALLLHPDALQNEGPERYGTWGMPLAYAAELSDPLPEALKTAMWRIGPWLAASVAQPNECPPLLPEKLERGVRWAVEGRAPDDLNEQLTHALWYQPDAAIKYAVLQSPFRFQRWHSFELSQLRSASYPSQASKIILRSICLSKFWTPESIRKAELPLDLWLSGSSGPAVWNPLINAGLTSNEELLKKASLGTGVHLIKAGTAKLEEFCINLRRRWITEGTPRDVIFAITSHVLSSTDFNTGQRHRLAMASNASEAVGLVDALGLNPEEFSSEQRRHLVATTSANDAGGLIKSRILKPEDFSDAERRRLAATASADGAVRLLNAGVLHPEDFSCNQRQRLAATASAEGVGALCKARLLSPEDFSDEQRQRLAATASAEGVAALLKTKVLRAEDFSEQQRQRLAAAASAEGAVKLFNAKVLRFEDFSQEQRQRLAATASAEGIRALLKAQILNSGDFSADQRERLAATPSAEGIRALLKARILRPEDFSDSQRQRVVATPSGRRFKDLPKVRDVREKISEADRRSAGKAVSTNNPHSPRSQSFGSEWIAPSPDSLSDFRLRQTISTQLRAMVFEGIVLNSKTDFVFIESQSFTNNVFCSATVWPPDIHLEVGQQVKFSVYIKFDAKKGIWSYAARNLNVLSRDES
jgi:NACHT domain/Putative DNA-binding domain